ncbi:glycosyltransferase [Aneurinibacillus sp. REN35]|uniref:glycosyltransferase n=2 Tax=Paenibacillaceae TaxID=186822 RepID=UPI0035285F0B
MDQKLMLSICMIVKNEEKNLRRCLDSLYPIINRKDVELIIVDTGSTDNTVKIIEEYPARLYFHEWNGNFSDMRNISISYAKGKWIFILDADEELENPENLLTLLDNKENEHYNTIRVTVKSLLLPTIQQFAYQLTERLFKNDGKFKYTGSIHNQPVFWEPVLVNSKIQIIHYGYNNEDKELMEAKFQRTATMLKREIKRDPNHIYYRFQLARSYLMHKDIADALKEIQEAYNLLSGKDKEMQLKYYGVLVEYARISYFSNRFEKVIEICEHGITLIPDYLDFYYYMGCAYLELGLNENGFKAIQTYFTITEKYDAGKVDYFKYNKVEIYTYNSKYQEEAAYKMIQYFYDKEKSREAFPYFVFIKDEYKKIPLFIKLCICLKQYENLYDYYRNMDELQYKNIFIDILENEKERIEVSQKQEIEKVFSDGEDVYAKLNKIRTIEEPQPLIREFITKNDISKLPIRLYGEVFYRAIQEGMNLFPTFKKINSVQLKMLVKELIDRWSEAKEYLIKKLKEEKIRENDYQSNRIAIAIAQVILLSEIEESRVNKSNIKEDCILIFDLYIEYGINYINYLYNIDHLRLTYQTLGNQEEKFFIILKFAHEALGQKNIRIFTKHYYDAVQVYPYMAELMKNHHKNVFTDVI